MPSLNVKHDTQQELYRIMAWELQQKIKENPKAAMYEIVKNKSKAGITFDALIKKMATQYRKMYNIK